ncbi:MAG: hypothetical protein EB141_07210 [Verrucomicrobia bacterium]|nr:hypothetical protein [Verrucomicrobiota bacterium]NBU09110.1 hypothetical protein [Pseudomonadota bacterium]NDA66019.1 hypothetical protein [Verrucomicrobiota bacterium]NDB75418.1 hypothetical protein [Verrucomicrobiota bacterium]NDD37866.1 hypothetical protein [Verrucomicrobiota bacterium]
MLKRTCLLLGLAVLLLPGCIEFDRQTVTYEHDTKADTLLIHQTYHGLYGADDVTQLSEQEREQLANVMKRQRTFFFANWIFELNVEGCKEQLTEAATPKTNSLEEAHRRAQTNALALLIANVRIENGKFYLNEKGQPCGTQRVTIRNVSKLIEAVNALLRRALEVEMKKSDSADERKLINESLARPGPFIILTGQQLRVRFPVPKEEFDKAGHDDEKLRQFLAEFVRSGGAMSHEHGEVHLSFGRIDAARESVTLPMAGKENYRGNALAHIRDTYGLAKDFDPKKDAEEFLKSKAAAPKQ